MTGTTHDTIRDVQLELLDVQLDALLDVVGRGPR